MAESSSDEDWVMLDSDNPADSSDDDRHVLVLSSCPTADHSDDGDDFYDPEDAEEDDDTPRPPPPKPLSGLFHHDFHNCATYHPFDALRSARELIPDPSFSAFPEKVAVLASTRGLVCLRGDETGFYYIANPVTFKRVRLPRHTHDHAAHGEPAVVITFEDIEHYHVVVAFHLKDGVFAFESFSSRTWKWRVPPEVPHEISFAEQVVAASGVGAIDRAFWRTPIGHILCYHPEKVSAYLLPTPKDMSPHWELGEMEGNLCVICMDEQVNEVDVHWLNRDKLYHFLRHRAGEDRAGKCPWGWACRFEGSKLSNREAIALRRSQGAAEVVIWDSRDERVLALDFEGRITRTISLSGEIYLADFIPYVRSNAEITRLRTETQAECERAPDLPGTSATTSFLRENLQADVSIAAASPPVAQADDNSPPKQRKRKGVRKVFQRRLKANTSSSPAGADIGSGDPLPMALKPASDQPSAPGLATSPHRYLPPADSSEAVDVPQPEGTITTDAEDVDIGYLPLEPMTSDLHQTSTDMAVAPPSVDVELPAVTALAIFEEDPVEANEDALQASPDMAVASANVELPADTGLAVPEETYPTTRDAIQNLLQSASELLGFDITDFGAPLEPIPTVTPQGSQFSALKCMLEIVQVPIPRIFDHLDELRMHLTSVEAFLPSFAVAAVQDVLGLGSNQADVKLAHDGVSQRRAHQQACRLLNSLIADAKDQKKILDDLAESSSRLDSSLSGLKAEKKCLEDELYKVNSQIQAVEEQALALPARVQAQKSKVAIAVNAVTRQILLTTPVPGDDAADQAILGSTRKFLDDAASAIAAVLP